jgi:hypothetical protein
MLAVFCLIPAGFVASIVQERVLNVKRLLMVSGASRSSYWMANFLWDWGMFLVLVIIAILVVGAAGHNNFSGDTIGAVVSKYNRIEKSWEGKKKKKKKPENYV